MFASMKRSLSRFRDDTFGGITALTITVFIIMLVSVGMAVDFMRHEVHRAELQDALDRGVIAATDLRQTVAPRETIEGYFNSTSFIKKEYKLDVDSDPVVGTNNVSAYASFDMPTYFLKLVGIPSLGVAARASATETRQKVEISLVLDISNSMWSKSGLDGETRFDLLMDSASKFVDRVMQAGSGPETTISVIPYGGSVALTPEMFKTYVASDAIEHDRSTCVQLNSSDFDSTDLPKENSLEQVRHFFHYNPDANNTRRMKSWCPYVENAILPLSNDAEAIKKHIKAFKGYDGTGSDIGLKWGVTLLDPDTNDLIIDLEKVDEVSEDVTDRPYAWKEPGTIKLLVFMSDGGTTYQVEPKDGRYDEDSDREHWVNNKLSGNAVSEIVKEKAAETQLQDQCKLARDNGVIVFSIGFDMNSGSDHAKAVKKCATDSAKSFLVTGNGIYDAFSQIAVNIQKLALRS